jgi:diguanylate cyclase (GGDEF)-like protein
LEIRDRKTVQAVQPTRKTASAKAADPTAPAAAAPEPTDVFSVAGISAAELTPNVRRAIAGLMAEVDSLRRELGDARSRIHHLEKLVDEDPMMPVVNRRAFVRELTRMMAFAQRYGVPASIIYFDVNNLKQINDAHGHAAGDAVLLHLSQLLIENVRTTDMVGRLGGDEMGVLLVQTDQAVADRKAIELSDLIESRPTIWQGQAIHTSVAYGAYAFAGDASASEIIDRADRAMYRAKSKKKNPAD